MFLIQSSILCCIAYKNNRDWRLLCGTGLLSGLAVLCKWLPGLLVLPLFFVYHYRKGELLRLTKELLLITGIAFLVFVPWQVYCAFTFPKEYAWEQYYNLIHFTGNVEAHGKPWWQHLEWARIHWNELIYLTFIWLLYVVYRTKSQNTVLILLWIAIPYIFFSMAVTKMPAYTLIAAPAIFISIALFMTATQYTIPRLHFFISCAIVLLAIRYCYERVKPFKAQSAEPEVTALLKNPLIQGEKNVIFNTHFCVEIMFFGKCKALNRLPTAVEMDDLISKGFNVFVVDKGDAPAHVYQDKRITLLKY